MSIGRIFTLLFLPMALWVAYSWRDDTLIYGSYELKKIDKIELIKLLKESKDQSSVFSAHVSCAANPQNDILIDTNVSEVNTTQKCDENSTHQRSASHSVEENITAYHIKTPVQALECAKGDEQRIFVIGDSMGEGISMGLSRLKKEFLFSYRSLAKCSTTTQYWLDFPHLEEQIIAYKPTVIFIVLGTNEYSHVTSASMVKMIKLKKRLETLGVQIRWITPPVEDSTKFFEAVREVFGENVYDSRFVCIPRGDDHIHSTPHGYEIWGKDILQSLHIPRRSSL